MFSNEYTSSLAKRRLRFFLYSDLEASGHLRTANQGETSITATCLHVLRNVLAGT